MQANTVSRDTLLDLELSLIDPDPDQPRKHFDPVKLAELAESMQRDGLAVPIMVRPAGERFIIVHGERRYRAALSLGWATIRAEIRRDLESDSARWLALIENIQRDDLTPIEEAREYERRLSEGLTQQQLAQRIGKTRSYIAQKLRLLTLPKPIMLYIERGALSEGHARQLLRLKALFTPDLQHDFGYEITGNFHQTLPEVSAWCVLGAVMLDMIAPFDYPPFWFRWCVGINPGGEEVTNRRRFVFAHRELEDNEADRMRHVFETVIAPACQSLCEYLFDAKGTAPQWEIAAFWWSAIVALFGMSVSDLHDWLDRYDHFFNSVLSVIPVYFPTKTTSQAVKSAERIVDSMNPDHDPSIADLYFSDLAACYAMPLVENTKRMKQAKDAIFGQFGEKVWFPSRKVFAPDDTVLRDTPGSDQHVH